VVLRKGSTVEYRSKNSDGYSYSQFCEHLHLWVKNSDASLHIEQEPGDKMYVDSGNYFHVVFTVSEGLNSLFYINQ